MYQVPTDTLVQTLLKPYGSISVENVDVRTKSWVQGLCLLLFTVCLHKLLTARGSKQEWTASKASSCSGCWEDKGVNSCWHLESCMVIPPAKSFCSGLFLPRLGLYVSIWILRLCVCSRVSVCFFVCVHLLVCYSYDPNTYLLKSEFDDHSEWAK